MDVASASRAPTMIDVRPAPQDASPAAKPERSFWQRVFGDDGVSFSTVLDVVNPLQHIPVVSSIYREITGDRIAPGAKLIGDTLFGGPIGLVLSALDVTVQGETGRDMGEHVVAMFKPGAPSDTDTAVASAAPDTASDAAPAAAPESKEIAGADHAEDPDSADDTLKAPVATAAKPQLPVPELAAHAPRSAFVAAAMRPRTPANGVGGAFVPLETRSTIAPPSLFVSPASLIATPISPDDLAPKRTEPKAATLPEARTVAANPDVLRSLRANGARAPAAAAARSAATPPPPTLAAPVDANGQPNEFADAMARNLERYMALRNRRPAPSKVDRAL
ncbi:MAG: hypothetical protein ACM30I_15325 [Gemmatimonas sp.]